MEDSMLRNLVFVVASAAALILSSVAFGQTAQYGTAEDARAMLEKAVAAVKADKTKALEMFNRGEGGFKDRDLYVFCANASDSVQTAHPTGLGARLKDFKDVKGFAFGEEIMRNATEGAVNEVTYLWPRPGSNTPVPKVMFFTKVGDQICGVGYYK
jgi:signal transduction histidine kinase